MNEVAPSLFEDDTPQHEVVDVDAWVAGVARGARGQVEREQSEAAHDLFPITDQTASHAPAQEERVFLPRDVHERSLAAARAKVGPIERKLKNFR